LLYNRTLIGTSVVVSTPIYVPIDLSINVSVNSAYSAVKVQADVLTALNNMLSFNVVDFAQTITQSDVYTIVSAVPGVNYIGLQQMVRRTNVGVSDIFLSANEIPVPGTLNVTTIGGIVVGDPTIAGAGASVLPTPSSAPVVNLLRCDTNTMHFALSWTPGSNTAQWFVEVDYYAVDGTPLGSTIVGPTSTPSLAFDLPNSNAYAFLLRTQAFNGSVGPIYSPTTSQSNVCKI
jgi:hypothetical protein